MSESGYHVRRKDGSVCFPHIQLPAVPTNSLKAFVFIFYILQNMKKTTDATLSQAALMIIISSLESVK